MAYAENTTVSVDKSIGEIITLIRKAGAERVAQMQEPTRIVIQFFLKDRMLRFAIKLPTWEEVPEYSGYRYRSQDQRQMKAEQRHMQRARALLLVIKAKLESIESGVETFDEAFLANIVTPEGQTVGDWLIPQVEEGYRIGVMPKQLLLTGGNS